MIPKPGQMLGLACRLQACALCGQDSNTALCEHCQHSLPLLQLPVDNALLWPAIRQHLETPVYDRLICLSEYRWPVSALIKKLKFQQTLWPARILARLFCQHCLRETRPLPELLIPVPLHGWRFITRRYNQAALLTRHIADASAIEVDWHSLRRQKSTQPQSRLSGAQRRRNLSDAFRLTTPLSASHIAIIDDVVTTGATSNAIARTLRQANPDLRIDIWAVAISLQHR